MISADKARTIAKRAQFNLYDSQLRLLFEEIEKAAKEGYMKFSFHSWECSEVYFDTTFWFSGAKNDSDTWRKVNKTLADLGYTLNYTIIKFDDERITISW